MKVNLQEVVRRFHQVLVREFGSRPPYDLSAPLMVADIRDSLVPYETCGEDLGVETVSEYEHALLCLLAGQGGYVRVGSQVAARRIQDLAESPDLDTGAYREFLTADVHLNSVGEATKYSDEARDDPTDSKECSSCTEELPQQEGVNFCPWCGDDVRRIPCPSCSRELRLNWNFCVACGEKVRSGKGL